MNVISSIILILWLLNGCAGEKPQLNSSSTFNAIESEENSAEDIKDSDAVAEPEDTPKDPADVASEPEDTPKDPSDGDAVANTTEETYHTIAIEETAGGSLVLVPAMEDNRYALGQMITLTAKANPGWHFAGWLDESLDSSSASITIEVKEDAIYSAQFALDELNLNVTVVGSGYLDLSEVKDSYFYGDILKLTAAPDSNFKFKSILIDGLHKQVNNSDENVYGKKSYEVETVEIEIRASLEITIEFTEESSPIVYSDDFEAYASLAEIPNWFDTDAGNALTQKDSYFKAKEIGTGEKVLFAVSLDPKIANIHSHLINNQAIESLSGYIFSGRMRSNTADAPIGVTFFSDYPNSDSYYRLRYTTHSGQNGFSLSHHPHSAGALQGNLESGIIPEVNKWYRFKVWVESQTSATVVKAKIWLDGQAEPVNWMVDMTDSRADRLKSGKIGVWSGRNGGKFWDDFVVEKLP